MFWSKKSRCLLPINNEMHFNDKTHKWLYKKLVFYSKMAWTATCTGEKCRSCIDGTLRYGIFISLCVPPRSACSRAFFCSGTEAWRSQAIQGIESLALGAAVTLFMVSCGRQSDRCVLGSPSLRAYHICVLEQGLRDKQASQPRKNAKWNTFPFPKLV